MSPQPVPVRVVALDHRDPTLPLPRHATPGSAGLDLPACLPEADRAAGWNLPPMGRVLVPTGLAFEIPPGLEGQVRPRSGLAVRHGITVLNSPGTIDSDYRGEVKVALINLGEAAVRLDHGERIAQLVIAAYRQAELQIVAAIAPSRRDRGGFGSTGTG
ncbi:MAG: dUTP diphosphatase [Pseudomonadota bacterium]